MTDRSDHRNKTAPSEGPGAGEFHNSKEGAMPLDSIAENADGGKVYQPSANRGSGNSGDVDRPRWNFQTELIRQHDYHHADGTYAFTTQKGRNGSGEQVWRTIRKNMLHPKERFELEEKREEFPGIGDEDWLLYRLPELVEARQQPDPLALVVEGEKDVETARDLGFPATCNPCGALKWRHEFSEHLRGFRVAVIPDNDERGRQHADMVARSIEDAAHLVKVVELPGAQSKGDLSDWVAKRRENGESDESIKAALNELIEHAPEADPPKRKKALAPNVDNVARVMEDSPDWNPDGEALIAYDEFRDEMMLLHPVPGSRTPRSTFRHRQWSDGDDVAAQRWFNRNGFPRVAKLTVHDAAVNVAQQNIISPVKHYLEALTWDGQKRLDRWLIDHCGADVDDEEGDAPGAKAKFVSEVGRRFLISAVARAMEPGCKADACLVLEGAQGIGKSTALRILADGREQPSGHRSWFNDSLQQFVGKDAQSALRGSWIVELGELSAMKRAEVEHIKGYLSRQVDRYRPAYGRSEVEMPRRCVFAGSTNKSDYLKDETGNRRFWPVRVTTIDLKRLLEDRNQLWAEAMHAFKKGEPWHLRGDAAAYQVRAAEQRSEEDPWSTVLDCLSDVKEVATSDVLELLGKPTGDQSKQDQMRVGAMLQRAGWTTRGKFSSGPRRHSRRYVNPDPEAKKEMDREVVEEANRRGGNGPL